MDRKRLLRLSGVCGITALLLGGCQQDEIRSYKTAKEESVHLNLPNADRPAVRLLAAIFTHGDRTWFFKLLGPVSEVAEHKAEFDGFIRSVHFTDQAREPITWTVPEGWRREPGSELRYATVRLGPKDSRLLVTVVALGAAAGSMLANVNRWRGHIGLPEVTEPQLSNLASEL